MFYHILKFLAAVIGIEPMHNRFRVYRLTAWLHRKYFSIILYFFENVHKIFRKLNYNEIMAKILVVDDEKLIREMIYKYATHEGFDVVLAVDGRDAIDKFGKEDFDVCIIDIMMPDMSGYDTLKKMREIKEVHAIFLTALGEEYDRVYGFDVGCEDYVTKPFSLKELMARIRVIVKRNNKQQDDKSYVIDGLVIDPVAHNISVDGTKIDLANKEFELLLYLVENRGKAVTRESIISNIWGYECDSDTRTLDTHMKLLRQDLGPYESLITTIRGVGYRFEKKD